MPVALSPLPKKKTSAKNQTLAVGSQMGGCALQPHWHHDIFVVGLVL